MNKRASKLMLATAAWVMAVFCGSCSRHETLAQQAMREGILLVGNNSDPQTLDPQLVFSLSDFRISESLYEGLTIPDPKTLAPRPGVAQSWEYDDKTLTWLFHLRANAKWSNGDPVTAHDFVFSYRRMLTPALGADYASMLYPIKNAEAFNEGKLKDFAQVGVHALDDHTLQIQLEHPTSYFLSLCYHQTFLPVHPPTITKFGAFTRRDAGWDRPGTLVGNGPFTLTKYVLGDVVEVKKNPYYWNAANVRLNGIRFFPTYDINAEERMFRNGLLHVTYTLPPLKTAFYRDSHSPYFRVIPIYGHYFYTLNVRKPPLDDPRVRLALSLAIDRQALVDDVVKGGQSPAYSLTPPSAQYQSRALLQENVAEAQRLLAAAGHPMGRGLPPIELTYNTSDLHRVIAEALQAMWKKNLGIDLRLVNVPAPEWLDRRRNANYQMIRAGWYADYLDPSTFLELFRSGSEEEQSGWGDPAYDGFLDAAAKEIDPAKRMEDFQQAEAILMKAPPIIPLYFYSTILLIRPELRGYENNLLDMHPFDTMYFDPSATTAEAQ